MSTVRETIESIELENLSPFASQSRLSKGRMRPMESCPLRTAYQRDRDRILHSKSFRRLQFKTQVFLSPEGDHYRTRLTHTLEVSQVARTIARGLRLNEDLAEAIALGHDLGHTPFGHIGERTLNRLNPNGFHHNEHSLRVVDVLEGKEGLNLSFEVRDGILNHTGQLKAATLEGQIVAKSDRIAYINHDIDDALNARIIKEFELPQGSLKLLGQSHGERIHSMISDIIETSRDKALIAMSLPVEEATEDLRAFLFKRVYQDEWRHSEEKKCDFILEKLFEYFLTNPVQMPIKYVEIAYQEGHERAVTDYLASMTDRFAMRLFSQLFVPDPFGVL